MTVVRLCSGDPGKGEVIGGSTKASSYVSHRHSLPPPITFILQQDIDRKFLRGFYERILIQRYRIRPVYLPTPIPAPRTTPSEHPSTCRISTTSPNPPHTERLATERIRPGSRANPQSISRVDWLGNGPKWTGCQRFGCRPTTAHSFKGQRYVGL